MVSVPASTRTTSVSVSDAVVREIEKDLQNFSYVEVEGICENGRKRRPVPSDADRLQVHPLPRLPKLSDEATMQIQNIDCDKIEFRELPGAMPVLSAKTARELADNIEAVGLLHPIAVRPRSDTPGSLLGHPRSTSVPTGLLSVLLKRPTIECQVLDIGEKEGELVARAENLFRLKQSQGQKSLVIKQWLVEFTELHPERTQGKAGGAATKRKADCARRQSPIWTLPRRRASSRHVSRPPEGRSRRVRSEAGRRDGHFAVLRQATTTHCQPSHQISAPLLRATGTQSEPDGNARGHRNLSATRRDSRTGRLRYRYRFR